jgi:hypothetical protein
MGCSKDSGSKAGTGEGRLGSLGAGFGGQVPRASHLGDAGVLIKPWLAVATAPQSPNCTWVSHCPCFCLFSACGLRQDCQMACISLARLVLDMDRVFCQLGHQTHAKTECNWTPTLPGLTQLSIFQVLSGKLIFFGRRAMLWFELGTLYLQGRPSTT